MNINQTGDEMKEQQYQRKNAKNNSFDNDWKIQPLEEKTDRQRLSNDRPKVQQSKRKTQVQPTQKTKWIKILLIKITKGQKSPKIKRIKIISGCLFALFILGIGIYGIVVPSKQISVTEPVQETKQNQEPQKETLTETKVNSEIPEYSPEMIEAERRLLNNDTEGAKIVFLTFDDGPSEYTEEILDVLKKYNVRATFFSLGGDQDLVVKVWPRIITEGHTLGNHTLNHNYDLYNNPEAFYANVEELEKFQKNILKTLLGKQTSGVFRFPGGSLTANETCCKGIVKRGYNYVDWNVSAQDAVSGYSPSPDEIVQNVINGCAQYDVSVVLCHAEIKDNTRLALPGIIESLQSQGYVFLPIKKQYSLPRQIEI